MRKNEERRRKVHRHKASNLAPLNRRPLSPYEAQLPQIKAHAKSLRELERAKPAAREDIEAANKSAGISRDSVPWLPIKGNEGFWTALIDADTARPKAYIPLDPY